jgi:hypothetical protein
MNPTSKILAGSMISVLFLAAPPMARAASKEARVTQIIRDVRLLPSEAAARPATVNDKVSEDTGVRTGGDSRSELTFPDFTITRLGSNTIFSFSGNGHSAKIESGSILLRVPKESGGSVKTSAVTVAVTGTTLIFESGGGTKSKLITLEGSARMALVAKPKDFRYVRAGQMLDVPAGATTLPMPVNINLNDVMKSHPLITDFRPLPSQPLIMAAAQQQPQPQAPPPSYTGPNINIDIGGILGGGGPHHHNPQQPPSRPPTTDYPPTSSPPGRTPGSTKNPPGTTTTTTTPPTHPPKNPPGTTTTTNQPPRVTKNPPATTTTIPRTPQKVPKPKPSPTPNIR